METINLLQKSLLIIVLALALLLGVGVLLANRKSKTNKFYFLTALAIVGWVLFGFLVYYPPLVDFQLLLGRLNFFFVAVWFVSIYSFIINFPKERKEKLNKFDTGFCGIGVALAFVSLFTNLIIENIQVSESVRTWTFGSWIIAYYTYAVATALIMIFRLIKSYKNEAREDKIKITYFVWGIGLVLVFNIVFNLIYPYYLNNSNFYFLGDFSVIFILGFTAYAILKYRLFNIRLIATESIVIALSLGLLLEIYLSSDFAEGTLKFIIWLLATYGGWQLVKSVKHEIEQKERIEILAKDLEKANEHLKEVDKLKDDFLSMASHELNTPIAAIKGYLSMILVEGMGGKIPAKARTYLDTVFTSADRLATMVKDLLNVSRIESNRIHIIWEQKPIEDIINQSMTEVMSKAREANHTLTFEAPKHKMPLTWFDSTRITEIVINMLGNSIKYTPNGGKITVRAINDDDKIVVSVEDNGKGIPKDRQKVVFEKFSQVDVLKDEVKGTGLGMYIAKKFIELHKGKIWFHSDGEGKGATFFFSLPIMKEKPHDSHEGEGAVLH